MDFTPAELQLFYAIGANRPRKKQRREKPEEDAPDLFSTETPEAYANQLYENDPSAFR